MADSDPYDGNEGGFSQVDWSKYKPTIDYTKYGAVSSNTSESTDTIKQYAAEKVAAAQAPKLPDIGSMGESYNVPPEPDPIKWDTPSLILGNPMYLDPTTKTITGIDTGFKLYMDEKGELTQTETDVVAVFDRNLEILSSGKVPEIKNFKWKDYLTSDEELYYDPSTSTITNEKKSTNYKLYLTPPAAGSDQKYLSLENTEIPAKYSGELRTQLDDALKSLSPAVKSRTPVTAAEISRLQDPSSIKYSSSPFNPAHLGILPISYDWDGKAPVFGYGEEWQKKGMIGDLKAFFQFGKSESVEVLKTAEGTSGPISMATEESSGAFNLLQWTSQIVQNWVAGGYQTGDKARIILGELGTALLDMGALSKATDKEFSAKIEETPIWQKSLHSGLQALAGPAINAGINTYRAITNAYDVIENDTPLSIQMGVTPENANQAFETAAGYHNSAASKYVSGSVADAIDELVHAYKLEAASGSVSKNVDPFYSYTFVENPVKYDDFLHNRAVAELQIGRLLTRTETRDIMEASLDPETEMRASMVLDVANVLAVIPATTVPKWVGTVLEKTPLAGKVAKSMLIGDILGTKAFSEAEKLVELGKLAGKVVNSIDEAKDAIKVAKIPAAAYQKAVNLSLGIRSTEHFIPFFNNNVGDLPINALMSFTGLVWKAPFKGANAAAKALHLSKALEAFTDSGPIQYLVLMGKNAFTSSGLQAKTKANTLLSEIFQWSKSQTTTDTLGTIRKAIDDLQLMSRKVKNNEITEEAAVIQYAGYGKKLVKTAIGLGKYVDEVDGNGEALKSWAVTFDNILASAQKKTADEIADSMIVKKTSQIAQFVDEQGNHLGLDGIRAKYNVVGSDDEAYKQFVGIVSSERAKQDLLSTVNHMLLGNYFSEEIERTYLFSKRIKTSTGRTLGIYKDSLVGLLLNTPNKTATDITKYGFGPGKDDRLAIMADSINTLGSNITNLWIRAVLGRWPSWLVNNVLESTFRFIFYGGFGSMSNVVDLFDDLRPILKDLEGFPINFLDSFAKSVKSKRVTPDQLQKGASVFWEIFSKNMSEAKANRKGFLGMLLETHFGMKAWEDAMRQTNQIFEAGLRIRMFNKFFKQNKARVQGVAFAKAMGALKLEDLITKGLSEVEATNTIEFASRLWQHAGNDPQLLRSLTSGDQTLLSWIANQGQWAPGVFGSALADTILTRDELLKPMLNDMSAFMKDLVVRRGGIENIVSEDLKSFFDNLRLQVQMNTVSMNPHNVAAILKNAGLDVAELVVDPEAQKIVDVLEKASLDPASVAEPDLEAALKTAREILGSDADAKSAKDVTGMLKKHLEGFVSDVKDVTVDTIKTKNPRLDATIKRVNDLKVQAEYIIAQVGRLSDSASAQAIQEIDRQKVLLSAVLQSVANTVSTELHDMVDINLAASGVLSDEIKNMGSEAVGAAWDHYWFLHALESSEAEVYMNEVLRQISGGKIEPYINGSIFGKIYKIDDLENVIGIPSLIPGTKNIQYSYVTKGSVTYSNIRSMIDKAWQYTPLGMPSIGNATSSEVINSFTGVSGASIKKLIETYAPQYFDTLEDLLKKNKVSISDTKTVNMLTLRHFGTPGAIYVDKPLINLTENVPTDFHEDMIRMFTDSKPVIGPLEKQDPHVLFEAAKEFNRFARSVSIEGESFTVENTVEKFMKRVLFAQYGASSRAASHVSDLFNLINEQFASPGMENWLWKEVLGDFRSNYGPNFVKTSDNAVDFLGNIRGMTTYSEGMIAGADRLYKSVVTATSQADVSTALHEIFHAIMGDFKTQSFIPSNSQLTLDEWAIKRLKQAGQLAEEATVDLINTDQTVWANVRELQAVAWERYLYEMKDDTGSSLPTKIRMIFDNISEMVRKVYRGIKSWAAIPGVEITADDVAETRVVFDGLFSAKSSDVRRVIVPTAPVTSLDKFVLTGTSILSDIPKGISDLYEAAGFTNNRSIQRLFTIWNRGAKDFESLYGGLTTRIVEQASTGIDNPTVLPLLDLQKTLVGKERLTDLANAIMSGDAKGPVSALIKEYKLGSDDKDIVKQILETYKLVKAEKFVPSDINSANLDYVKSLLRTGYIKLGVQKPSATEFIDKSLTKVIQDIQSSGAVLPDTYNVGKYAEQLDNIKLRIIALSQVAEPDPKEINNIDKAMTKLASAIGNAYAAAKKASSIPLYQTVRNYEKASSNFNVAKEVIQAGTDSVKIFAGAMQDVGRFIDTSTPVETLYRDATTGLKRLYTPSTDIKLVLQLNNSEDNLVKHFGGQLRTLFNDAVYHTGLNEFIVEFKTKDEAEKALQDLTNMTWESWAPVENNKEALLTFGYGVSDDLDEARKLISTNNSEPLMRELGSQLSDTFSFVNNDVTKLVENQGLYQRGRDIVQTAKDEFGVIDDPFGSRMILDNGDLLDLGFHTHYQLSKAYGVDPDIFDNSYLTKFMQDTKSIYWSAHYGQVNIEIPAEITRQQKNALRDSLMMLANNDPNYSVLIVSKLNEGLMPIRDVIDNFDTLISRVQAVTVPPSSVPQYQKVVKTFGSGNTAASPRLAAYQQTSDAFWEAYLDSDYGGNPLRRVLSALLDGADIYDRKAAIRGLRDVAEGHRVMSEGPVPNIDEQTLADTVESLANQLEYAAEFVDSVIIKKDKWMPAPFMMEKTGSDIATQAMMNNLYMATTSQEMLKGIQMIESHMGNILSGNLYGGVNMSPEATKTLADWGQTAARELDSMLYASIHGGVYESDKLDDALGLTNHIMLDYTDFSRYDQIMKSIFPFWMYPSRTLPFWAETFARNPELVAFYYKYQQYSNRKARQVGATNSNGETLNSLQGYIPIPGTKLWFNPTAPFAFKFVFPFDYTNSFSEGNDEGIAETVLRMLYEQSSIRGFGMSPLAYMTLSKLMSGQENMPRPGAVYEAARLFFPVELVPPFIQRWILAKARHYGFSSAPEVWDPEVGWKDFMIERKLLQEALGKMRSTSSESEKMAIAKNAQEAIRSADRDKNALWLSARDSLEASEYYRKIGSRLTGFFTKEYDTDLAELYKLRDEINLLKDMVNNDMGAKIFDMSLDEADRYRKMLDKRYETPEGFIWNDYQKIRFVTDPITGLPVTDKNERRNLISQAYAVDEASSGYYDKLSNLQRELEEKLALLPVGSPSELRYKYLDKYFDERTQLEKFTEFDLSKRAWNAGLKPDSVLADHYKYLWWQIIRETAPRFDTDKETYAQFKDRLSLWKVGLPALAEREMPTFMANLGMDQVSMTNWSKSIGSDWTNFSRTPQDISKVPQALIRETTAKGYEEFLKVNDTVYEALENAWDALVLDPYFSKSQGLGSAQKEVFDQDWKAAYKPPTVSDMIAQIKKEYGQKFTDEEIRAAFEGRKINTPQENLTMTFSEQDKQVESIWTLLNWASASGQANQLSNTFKILGGEDDVLTTWYTTKGNPDALKDTVRFKKFYDDLNKAAQTIDLQPLDRAKLDEVAEAQRLDKEFDQMRRSIFGDRIDEIIKVRGGLTYASDQKAWANMFPNEAKLYTEAVSFKNLYADDNQLWAKYYLPKRYKGK